MKYDKSLFASETEEETDEIAKIVYSESDTENEDGKESEESNVNEGYECRKRKIELTGNLITESDITNSDKE